MKTREEIVANFKSGLASFMGRRGHNLRSLAKESGMSAQNAFLLKHGRNLPKLDTLVNLIDAGMSLQEIFGSELAQKLANSSGFVEKESLTSGPTTYDILEEGLAAMIEKVKESRNA